MSYLRGLTFPRSGEDDVEREASRLAAEAKRTNAIAAHESLKRNLIGEKAKVAEYDAQLARLAADYSAASEPWRRRRIQLVADELEERRDRRMTGIRSLESEIKKGPNA